MPQLYSGAGAPGRRRCAAAYLVQASTCRVKGLGFKVQGSRFKVQGSRLKVYVGFRVQGLGLRA